MSRKIERRCRRCNSDKIGPEATICNACIEFAAPPDKYSDETCLRCDKMFRSKNKARTCPKCGRRQAVYV